MVFGTREAYEFFCNVKFIILILKFSENDKTKIEKYFKTCERT